MLFKSKQMSRRRVVVLLRRVGRDFSPCSGDQWVQGGKTIKVHSTHQGFFFLYPPSPFPSPLLLLLLRDSSVPDAAATPAAFSVVKPQVRSSTNSNIQTSNHVEQRVDLFSTVEQVDFFFFKQKWMKYVFEVVMKFTQIHVFTYRCNITLFPPQSFFPELSGALNN